MCGYDQALIDEACQLVADTHRLKLKVRVRFRSAHPQMSNDLAIAFEALGRVRDKLEREIGTSEDD